MDVKPLPQFLANITRTVSASFVQFAITLIATPIMTRLYDPTAYATFGIINTAAATIAGIGLFSLPSAFAKQKDSAVCAALMKTILLLLAGLVVLSGIGAAGMAVADHLHGGMHISWVALALLPVLVLTTGARQIMVSIATSHANFARLAFGQILEVVKSRGSSIALGAAFGGHPAFILLAVAAGQLSTILLMFKMVPKNIWQQWRLLIAHVPQVKATMRQFSDFVIYNTASQQMQPAIALVIQMMIAACFSGTLAGHYILATSILALPIMLISMATAPVVYSHFAEIERNHRTSLMLHFMGIAALYFLVGACGFSLLFFYGPEIFRFAFGPVWTHAGEIAGILSIAYVGHFVTVGIQAIFLVTQGLKLRFKLDVITNTLMLVFVLLFLHDMAFDKAMIYLSALWMLRNVVLFIAAIYVTAKHTRVAA